jgi:hypothetical protein
MKRRNRLLVAACGLLLAAGGCNKSDLVEASGRLTYKGQPVPSTYVFFHPAEEGQRSSQGLTDDEGNFKLTNSRTVTGVKRGPCTVTLRYYVSADEEMRKTPPKATRELQAVISKYADVNSAPKDWHVEITKGGQFFDLKIPE